MASTGTTETEIKLALADPAAIVPKLSQLGFSVIRPRVYESNTLFDFPDSGLKSRQTMLRLRKSGEQAIVTFKGPAESGRHKSREELETTVGDAELFDAILRRIGLESGFRYEKYRTEFGRPSESGVVTLDETPIGWFLELEGDPDWIDTTASGLGFSESDYITLSYASLYLQYCEIASVPPTSMAFD